MTESSWKTNETSSRRVNGVAGLNMTAELGLSAQLAVVYAIETFMSRKDGASFETGCGSERLGVKMLLKRISCAGVEVTMLTQVAVHVTVSRLLRSEGAGCLQVSTLDAANVFGVCWDPASGSTLPQ